MGISIVYIVGTESRHEDIELRMSLRSIAKHGSGVSKVIVAGHPPRWLSKEVVGLEVEDKYDYKHSNILLCIEKVVERGMVKGDFLYSSDDHFYVKDVDFSHYPYYIKSENLRDFVYQGDSFYYYHKSLVDTRRILLSHNLPAKDYSQHCNTHMSADVIKDNISLIHDTYFLPYGAEPTSLIMNAWSVRPDAPRTTPRKDLKISYAYDYKDLKEKIGDNECFSIGDAIFNCKSALDFFHRHYPDKCIFEA